MKKIILLLLVCLLAFCGCYSIDAPTKATEPETEKVCRVIFDSQGGSAVETQVVAWGGKVSEPSAPTKKCQCEFDGWYLGDEKWSFIGYSVTEDITLTARWVECHNLNDKEIEILNGFIASRYSGKKTWQDVDNIQKQRSADFECYDYTITFEDGSSFRGSIWCEGVDN